MRLTDLQLRTCTRWQGPDGVVYLEVQHTLVFYMTLAANNPPLTDVELGTPAEYDFECKVVSYTGVTPGTLIQIQWPDGRYLSNPGLDFFSFVGTGKRARLIDPHKLLSKQSKVRINLDNSAVAAVSSVELYFEGVLRVPFVAGSNGG